MSQKTSTLKVIATATGGLIVLIAIGSMLGLFGGMMGSASKTIQKEYSAEAILNKYEWFKNAAAALAEKKSNISVYEAKLKPLRSMDRKDMDRTDKEQLGQWEAEVAGVKASYNALAGEWNAQISKFNWKPFKASLPTGSEDILQMDVAKYINN